MGKTTLAKTVYNHRAIHHHFELRAWVSLPDEGTDDNELENIFESQIMSTTVEPNAKDQYYWIQDESSGNSSCKIEEIEDEASSIPSINKAQCKSKQNDVVWSWVY